MAQYEVDALLKNGEDLHLYECILQFGYLFKNYGFGLEFQVLKSLIGFQVSILPYADELSGMDSVCKGAKFSKRNYNYQYLML